MVKWKKVEEEKYSQIKGFSIVCFSVPEYISKASPNYSYTLTSA